jgi:hypothetical protein
MKNGNWIPISKTLLKELPKGRAYSKVEAMFSLTIDYDCGRPVSIQGLSKLWGWNRKTVVKFLSDIGISIDYKGHKFGQKKGQVSIQVGIQVEGQVKFIDSKGLPNYKDRSKDRSVHRSVPTTKEPKPKPSLKEKKNIKEKFGINDNVLLKKEQFGKLVVQFGRPDTDSKIDDLSLWLSSTGKIKKCHYSTILAWDRKDKKQYQNTATDDVDSETQERIRIAAKKAGF